MFGTFGYQLAISWKYVVLAYLLIAKDIILGLTEYSSAQGTINNILIILKYYIYMSADATVGTLI